VYKCTSVQVYKCTSVQVYKCTSLQVYKFTSLQVYKFTSLQVYNNVLDNDYKTFRRSADITVLLTASPLDTCGVAYTNTLTNGKKLVCFNTRKGPFKYHPTLFLHFCDFWDLCDIWCFFSSPLPLPQEWCDKVFYLP
jgi:hypothetical protein